MTVESTYLAKRDSLYRFAFGMVQSEDDAQDILHDAYEKVMKKSQLKLPNSLEAYFFITTRNLCFDFLKRKKRFSKLEEGVEDNFLIDNNELEDKNEMDILMLFLDNLPPTQRGVILLKDIEGYNYDEVASMLSMDKNNIRVNLSIARKKIRTYFEKLRELELKTK